MSTPNPGSDLPEQSYAVNAVEAFRPDEDRSSPEQSEHLGDEPEGNGHVLDERQMEAEFCGLVEKVKSGDPQAIEILVDRYQRAILRIVRARLGRQMRSLLDSMDIVQSVHRSLLVGLRSQRFQFQSADQLIALAVLMVQRKVSRHWSRLKTGLTCTVSTSSHADMADEFMAQVPASSPSPSMEMVGKELLSACLSQLDELDQQLVQLKLAGQSTAEVAEQLGRDPAFIRMRWSRLRQTLRESGCLN